MSERATTTPVDTSAPIETPSARRLPALDGLRGIAALVVVVHHTFLLAQPYLDTSRVGDAWWWMASSPLKIANAGSEAVLVFFVLSGLVVALPALRGRFSWGGYYVARAVRLYLPVWASLVLASVLIIAFVRDPSQVTPGSWMATTMARSFSWSEVGREAALVFGGDDSVNNVLWSLRWEVWFSALLPLFIAVCVGLKALTRQWWIFAFVVVTAALMCGAAALGTSVGHEGVLAIPVFMYGTIMAVGLPAIREWTARRSTAFWIVLVIFSWLVLIAPSIDPRLYGAADEPWFVTIAPRGLGAAGLVFAAVGWRGMRRFLEARVSGFLGRISFSLYLVHVPLIGTLGYLLGDTRWPLVAAIAIPVSVLVSWLFQLVVEGPSHRLARWLGARIRRPTRRAARSEPVA